MCFFIIIPFFLPFGKYVLSLVATANSCFEEVLFACLYQSLYPHYTESSIQFFGYYSCKKKRFFVVFGADFWDTRSLLYLSDNRSKEQVKTCRNSYDLVLLGLDRAGQQEVKFS